MTIFCHPLHTTMLLEHKNLKICLRTSHGHEWGMQALQTSKNQMLYTKYDHFEDMVKRSYVTMTKPVKLSLLGITSMQSCFESKV